MDIEMRERSSRHRDGAGRKKTQSPRPLLSTCPSRAHFDTVRHARRLSAAPAAAAGAESDAAADSGSEAASDTVATGDETTDGEGADGDGGAAANSGGAAPMEIDG